MSTANQPSIWERLPELDDHELSVLTEVAVSVLGDHVSPEDAPDADAPWDVLAQDLAGELDAEGVAISSETAAKMVEDERVSRDVALATLAAVASEPRLAREVERAYQARQGMMIVDAGVVLGVALLLFVLKLKRAKAGREGVEMDFYEVSDRALGSIRGLLGLGG